jgi:predicted transcriptional regulator YdeE
MDFFQERDTMPGREAQDRNAVPAGGSVMQREIRNGLSLVGITVAMIFCSTGAFSGAQKVTDMNPRAVLQEGFTVVGISVRTNNAEQMTPEAPIGKQWSRLFKEGVLAAIPNKADANIVALYTDYASDKDGDYTYVLGARVTKVENLPAGMVAKTVPAGRYALFTSEKGPVQKIVVEMWQKVWATPKAALGGERSYKTDYEVYDQRAQNPADSIVDLYIAVR